MEILRTDTTQIAEFNERAGEKLSWLRKNLT